MATSTYLGNIRGPRGYSVGEATVGGDGHLLMVLADGSVLDAGDVRGPQGLPGTGAVPADDAVAGYISTTGSSATKSILLAMFARKYSAPRNVKDFGAVGDGVTNDTAAFLNALATPGTVYMPNGTYLVSSTLSMLSGSSLIGESRSGTIIKAALSFPVRTNIIQSANNSKVAHANYVERLHLAHFTVDGDAWNRTYEDGDGSGDGSNIRLTTVKNVLVEDVRTINGFVHNLDVAASVYLDDGNVNSQPAGPSLSVVLRNVESVDNRLDDGITTHNSGDIIVSACSATRTRAPELDSNGIEIDEGSYRVLVEGCYSQGNTVGFQAKGHLTTTPARDVTFRNCVAEGCEVSFDAGHQKPSLLPAGQTSDARNIRFDSCTSLNPLAVTPGNQTIAIRVTAYRNVRINNFVARGGAQNYIFLSDECDEVTIDGVYAENVWTTPIADRGWIHAFAAYGQTANRLIIRDVIVNGAIAGSVVRASGAATTVTVDGITAVGSDAAQPLVYLAGVNVGTQISRISATGFSGWFYSQTVTVGTFSIGMYPGRIGRAIGAGTPEGVVMAPIGSQYTNTSGGTGTTLYVKRSGIGNTGWFAIA